MLSNRCLSVMSVMLVYGGQTLGWIKMPLGTEVGLGPGHIVLDGDRAPDGKGHSSPPPLFGPCLLWPNGCPSQLLLSSCTFLHYWLLLLPSALLLIIACRILVNVSAVQEAPVKFPSTTFVVDLMYQPGRLMTTDSSEAATYCQPGPLHLS